MFRDAKGDGAVVAGFEVADSGHRGIFLVTGSSGDRGGRPSIQDPLKAGESLGFAGLFARDRGSFDQRKGFFEQRPDFFHVIGAFVDVLGEQPVEEVLEFVRKSRTKGWGWGVDVMVAHLFGIAALEGGLAGQHLVQDDAEGVDIGAVIDVLALGLFGGEVAGSAEDVAALGEVDAFGFFGEGDLGDTKVEDLD